MSNGIFRFFRLAIHDAQLIENGSVIFSSWTKILDLVGVTLQSNGFRFQQIDGRQSEAQRRSVLEDFRTNAERGILLASVGTAGDTLRGLSRP